MWCHNGRCDYTNYFHTTLVHIGIINQTYGFGNSKSTRVFFSQSYCYFFKVGFKEMWMKCRPHQFCHYVTTFNYILSCLRISEYNHKHNITVSFTLDHADCCFMFKHDVLMSKLGNEHAQTS
jgi:hypothetical protein